MMEQRGLYSAVTDSETLLRCFYSLAGVVDGVVRAVTRAVAAEGSREVLRCDGGAVARAPGLGFHPRPLQDVVRVLTCGWTRNKQKLKHVLVFGDG